MCFYKYDRDALIGRERGFTLVETVIGMLLTTLILMILLGIVYIGFSRVGSVERDGGIVRFEQSLSRFLEQDFRENRVLSIEGGSIVDEKLVMKVETVSGEMKIIRYENRLKGFYRVIGDESFLISEIVVSDIEILDNKIRVKYMIDGYEKAVTVVLVK